MAWLKIGMLYFFFFTNNRKLSIQTPTIFINNGFKKIFWLKMFILYIVVRKADEKWMVFFCDGIFVWKKNRIPNKKSQPLPLIIKAFWDITLYSVIFPQHAIWNSTHKLIFFVLQKLVWDLYKQVHKTIEIYRIILIVQKIILKYFSSNLHK